MFHLILAIQKDTLLPKILPLDNCEVSPSWLFLLPASYPEPAGFEGAAPFLCPANAHHCLNCGQHSYTEHCMRFLTSLLCTFLLVRHLRVSSHCLSFITCPPFDIGVGPPMRKWKDSCQCPVETLFPALVTDVLVPNLVGRTRGMT